jgi:AcrR family transcriptional regulator
MAGEPALLHLIRSGDEPGDEVAERILDAALDRFSTYGVRRTSVEDIARAVDVNRVTVYRRFSSKQALLQAVVARETRRFFAALDAATRDEPDPRERFVEAFALGVAMSREHPLLTRLLATEPETLLPVLTVDAEPVLAAGRALLAPLLRDAGAPADERTEVAAELLVRVAISLVLTPGGAVRTDTPEAARAFARSHLLPLTGL